MEESPVEALRKKPDNSISRCWQLLAERKVEAIVSAGNTGAMVAGGLRLRLFLKDVRRPGIAAVMPTLKGPCVLLDVGANVSPKPEHLFQYGVMGSIFARHILKRDKPTIGLMNVGSEEDKGHDLAKETHALFNDQLAQGPVHRQRRRPRHPQGRLRRHRHRWLRRQRGAEGLRGRLRIRHEDGRQGTAGHAAKREARSASKRCKHLIKRYDYHEHGGAPLLGIDGICIICHGSSGERAIKNALASPPSYARSS